MNTSSASSRVVAAQAELDNARAALINGTASAERRFRDHRVAWILGGGFVGGFALAFAPRRFWAGVGALVGSSAALAARSVLTPMIAGALLARVESANESTAKQDQ
jgi:hypothetical protein